MEELNKIIANIRRKLRRSICRSGLAPEAAQEMLTWENSGFSLHEEVQISRWDREGLERLLKYCSRPGLSPARLMYAAKTNIVLYRSEPREGRREMLVMPPVEFLRRWALLMPPPHKNLVHYYGAPAPRSPLRPHLVAKAMRETDMAHLKERVEKLKRKPAPGRPAWQGCSK